MNFLFFALSCLYFFLPAYFANLTPPLVKKAKIFEFLAKPVDFNKKFLGKPIFGSHKTWRGVIFAFLSGFFTAIFQRFLFHFPFFQKISLFDYTKINIFFFAFLISFGAIFGDLLFAFIKRRLGLLPGAPFLPFDQTNYVIGVALFLEPILKLGLFVWFFLFFATFFLHIIVNRIGYHLKVHSAKW